MNGYCAAGHKEICVRVDGSVWLEHLIRDWERRLQLSTGSANSARKEHRSIPESPEAAAWTPPKTSLPQELVDAASFMLKHGLGDPRGGKFAKAKVIKGETWRGGGEAVETYGWLMPASGKEESPIRRHRWFGLRAGHRGGRSDGRAGPGAPTLQP